MILKCTFSYFLVYTPSPKILKQYSIKVKKPCFPHFCYPSPAMSRNITGYFSFHYRRYAKPPPLPCPAALRGVLHSKI